MWADISPGRKRALRTLATVACALLAAVVLLRGCVDAIRHEVLGNCTTTRVVLAKTVPVLEQRFDVVALQRTCEAIESLSDGAEIALAGRRPYTSRHELAAAVTAQLGRAGWTTRAGSSRLAFRDGRTRYTASVRVHTIAPALAFVNLQDPAFNNRDPRSGHVDGDVPQRELTTSQQLRYLTFTAYTPRFVPRGYSNWAPATVPFHDFADVDVDLTENRTAPAAPRPDNEPVPDPAPTPSLRSIPRPGDWSSRKCDAFTAGDAVCRLWGTTTSGIKVYIPRDAETRDGLGENPTALVDGTVVVLYEGHAQSLRPAISRADVLRIFDSLRALNTPARR
ncbi:MAG: hypothetical protein QOE11_2831 [Solirubrobacteraceae bacterium]|nr:hypothetical protein [Solirubrobacteraceae bacterium]